MLVKPNGTLGSGSAGHVPNRHPVAVQHSALQSGVGACPLKPSPSHDDGVHTRRAGSGRGGRSSTRIPTTAQLVPYSAISCVVAF